jgi:hypothetical protein
MPPRQRKGKASEAMRKQSEAMSIPPSVFKYRLLLRLILFYTTGLAVKKHLPTAKRILPSVAAVKGIGLSRIHSEEVLFSIKWVVMYHPRLSIFLLAS